MLLLSIFVSPLSFISVFLSDQIFSVMLASLDNKIFRLLFIHTLWQNITQLVSRYSYLLSLIGFFFAKYGKNGIDEKVMLKEYYSSGINTVKSSLESLSIHNPIGYDLSKGHPFYEYKEKL